MQGLALAAMVFVQVAADSLQQRWDVTMACCVNVAMNIPVDTSARNGGTKSVEVSCSEIEQHIFTCEAPVPRICRNGRAQPKL